MLPAALSALRARYPGIELEMTRTTAKNAMHALERGAGDIAIVRGSETIAAPLSTNFVVTSLMQDETVLVVRPDHPLAGRKKATSAEEDKASLSDAQPSCTQLALDDKKKRPRSCAQILTAALLR